MKAFLLLLTFAMTMTAQTTETDATTRLHELLRSEWEWRLRDSPEMATWMGDTRYDDRWSDRSPEARAKRDQHPAEMLAALREIDRAKLSPDDQLNYDLFKSEMEMDLERQKFPGEFVPLNQMGGSHQRIPDTLLLMPKRTEKDFANIVKRLRASGALFDDEIALMREGLKKGVTPPRITLREIPKQLESQIVDDPTKSAIYALIDKAIPSTLSAEAQAKIRADVAAAIEENVVPGYRRLHQFFVSEYLPKTREAVGISAVPDGAEWYRFNVRDMTTTDMTPDQIHEIGLSEVKRIRAEMEKVKEQAGFKGTLPEFFQFLRTDERFYFKDRESLLVEYRNIAKRIDPELPRLFGRLPRLTYGVRPVPEYSEKTQTTAYYNSGSLEAGRAGYFYANTYNLPARPKWEMESLTVHEAVPGHHLQIALAQEIEGLPEFRQNARFTAFVEGWGLYSESLGPELGLYKDPYSKFGQLTYEMWRAIRLVVDTGMHSKGWSRQQAIDFFKENASKTEHDITVEIDRYIVWPGQALAYKIGELKIKELRKRAETKLGETFDIRAFHDTVLGAGPLPLAILERRVDAWIASSAASASR